MVGEATKEPTVSGRETILSRVRDALRDVPPTERPEDVPVPREYRRSSDRSPDQVLGDFAVAGPAVTVEFDVTVYPDVPNGTIISNQAFVTAADQGVTDVPSDDPRTEVENDPTRDVVGNYPLLFAEKSAALQIDNGSPGIVDPGDTLRYTITIYNNSASEPATMVELLDNVPDNLIYVADSTTLDGAPVGQPDSGVFPLEARILVGNDGVLDPGASTTVEFQVVVDMPDVATATPTLPAMSRPPPALTYSASTAANDAGSCGTSARITTG